MDDSVPRTIEGAVLSIADKADSIAGMFALGLVPSGSKDPFGLRRQANGIVKTIAEHKLPLKLERVDARMPRATGTPMRKRSFTPTQTYCEKRLRSFSVSDSSSTCAMCSASAYDVVNAVLAAGSDRRCGRRGASEALSRGPPVSRLRSDLGRVQADEEHSAGKLERRVLAPGRVRTRLLLDATPEGIGC